jgi:carbon-monoxide dehydrogenase medium subunit
MQPFTLHRVDSLAAAASTFGAAAEARYLAGGQTLIPVLKQRLAAPTDLVALAGVPGLSGIKAESGRLTIGAMTRHADVAASADVRRLIPALARLAGGIGDPHVRNRGTIGGSLANNDPAADYPAAVLGLGATVVTDRRRIVADEFFQGLFTTALAEGEIVTAVEFPVPERAGYVKMPHPASRFCLVGLLVARTTDGVRVAVTGAGQEGVFRIPAMEAALARSFAPEAIAGITVDAGGLLADIHAPAAYRAHLVTVLARRAVAAALA